MTKINKKQILNLYCLTLVSLYIFIMPQNNIIMKIESFSILILSVILLYKTRKNLRLFISFLFLVYNLYSVVVGEYLTTGLLGVPIYTVKNVEVYYMLLRIVFVFMIILTVFIRVQSETFKINPINNNFLYIFFISLLFYILVFGIKRTHSISYEVSITPVYEYGILIFLFAYYTSGKSVVKKFLLILLSIIYILQDYYYGGRISALQLIILSVNIYFIDYLGVKRIINLAVLGLIVNNIVSYFRNSDKTLVGFNILAFVKKITSNYFVFDTSVYAYYASATHIATLKYFNISYKERLSSFFNFFKAIFVNSGNDSGNLTRFISDNYFLNLGGGLYPSFFYFWLGWIGVIISALLLVVFFNNINRMDNDLEKITILIVISYTPRWFLYNPLMIFRPVLFGIILYFFVSTFHANAKYIINDKGVM